MAAVPFSWGTCGFPLSVLQWLPFSGSAPGSLRLVDVFVGLVGSWYSTWFSSLCQHGFPLAGSAPSPFCCLSFAGAAPFQAPVCGSPSAVGPCGWVGGVFTASLGFLPCAVLFLRACSLRSFPSCRLPWGFPVNGCPSFCFPGDVGWASALPFFFCASPAPLACRVWLGYAPYVRVLQLQWYLLGLTVRSPCCPSLTLGWVCFWPTVFQAFVGCDGGLGCPSWFVILFLCLLVLHLSGVGVAWSQVCGPSCDSWVLDSSDARLRRPDALASGRTLSFCRRGSLPWAFVRTWVSRARPCLGSYLPLVVLPFPCPGFRLATLAIGWFRDLLFSWALPWVLPSRFQCWLLA